jgi:hypothetical protein
VRLVPREVMVTTPAILALDDSILAAPLARPGGKWRLSVQTPVAPPWHEDRSRVCD